MNGVWPKSRAHAGRVALALALLSGCAHGRAAGETRAREGAVQATELAGLRAQIAARDQTIQQLEGRLAMLEASQRQLRGELEAERSLEPMAEAAPREVQVRETVRIGSRSRSRGADAGQGGQALAQSPATEQPEARPMLRLHAERRDSRAPELTSTWQPPTTSERLSISPVPALPGAARASVAGTRVNPPAPTPQVALLPVTDDLYAHALDLLRRRELAEALRELDAFVKTSPGDARIGRAQFWRGEIHFTERQYAAALSAFEQALQHEPLGDKTADLLLRIARCHRRLGASERARAALLRLRTQFPDSAAARQAEHDPEPVTQEDT